MSVGRSDNLDGRKIGSREEFSALASMIDALDHFDDESRLRLVASVLTFYGLRQHGVQATEPSPIAGPFSAALPGNSAGSFSEDRTISPKEFLAQKRPETDIERAACLAYYLTHFRNTPQFKTLEISKLNTEAAQVKFSNAAYAVDNALRRGFLASASHGNKQITAMGEQFVLALPDRAAARDAIAHMLRRRRTRKIAKDTGA